MGVNTIQHRFGRALRANRTRLGFSQEGFALHVGLHRTYVGGIERGERNPSLRNMQRLADGLGVPLSELLRDAEQLE